MAIPKKPRKCRHCKQMFQPTYCGQNTCSFECQVALGVFFAERSKAKREKAERIAEIASTKILRARVNNTKTYWWKQARKYYNAWVRARDEGKECISCDTILINTGKPGGDYDAGHCRSVGSAKHLEFDERNVHGQCKHCNSSKGLGGNYHAYRAKLPSRIGQDAFDSLMADQDTRGLTISDYKAIVEVSKRKLKELKNGN